MDNSSNHNPSPCDELRLSAYLDDEVTAEERAAIESHVLTCTSCAAVLDRFFEVDRELTQTIPPHHLHAGVTKRITAEIARSKSVIGLSWFVAVAAALVLAFISGAWFGNRGGRYDSARVANEESAYLSAVATPPQTAPDNDEPSTISFDTKPGPFDAVVERNDVPPMSRADVDASTTDVHPSDVGKSTRVEAGPDDAAPVSDASNPGAKRLAPIQLQLPAPYFGGTPLSYFGEHLEERSFTPREAFLAPMGTKVVSRGRPVTSSDPSPAIGTLAMITDGKKGYESEHLVELARGMQWIEIELGTPCEIYAVVIWHYHAAERVYFDVVVKTAMNAGMASDVTTVYNNDYDNSSGLGVGQDLEYIETNEGRLITCDGVVGRYVRCYSNGNTSDEANDYVEVEVWGIPVSAPDASSTQAQSNSAQ